MSLGGIVKGEAGTVGMVFGGKGDWIGRPSYEVRFIRGVVKETD
jgi:hypothetical protein